MVNGLNDKYIFILDVKINITTDFHCYRPINTQSIPQALAIAIKPTDLSFLIRVTSLADNDMHDVTQAQGQRRDKMAD